MRHLALTLSIIGAILVSTGALGYFMMHAATGGIYTLYVLGGIALLAGTVCFVGYFLMAGKHNRQV